MHQVYYAPHKSQVEIVEWVKKNVRNAIAFPYGGRKKPVHLNAALKIRNSVNQFIKWNPEPVAFFKMIKSDIINISLCHSA